MSVYSRVQLYLKLWYFKNLLVFLGGTYTQEGIVFEHILTLFILGHLGWKYETPSLPPQKKHSIKVVKNTK